MMATRTTTFYNKIEGGYQVSRLEHENFDLGEFDLPESDWYTETMYVEWNTAE